MGTEELKDKVILVTGGAGFIGSHLCEGLLELGAKVICVDSLLTGKTENFTHLKEKFGEQIKSFKFDVNTERGSIELLFRELKPDYVFHYAAMVGVKKLAEEPLDFFVDMQGIRNIFELSKEFGVKKVVFSSSSEVYGEPINPGDKAGASINIRAHDPYALTKLYGECIAYHYFKQYDLPTCSLRFFNVYGPRQESSDYGFVTGVFIRQVLVGKNPTVFDDGSQTRDFVYVKDNVEAAICALLTDRTNGKTLNIGRGTPTTILDLAQRVIAMSGKDYLKPEFMHGRGIEIKHRNPDVAQMKELLNYELQTNLDEGLKKTFDWYKENVK
ncbi:MAG: SDR family NAD(P)-dependent oxidoreductase [Patescibacteria group bacterium]|nr:SDR family NAD(P)-dependent oxidoreductase [Patescibacteria group bacterium]